MTDIPNTEYITVNKDGIFVGGKPATTYRGEEIRYSNVVRKSFADIQRLNKNVAELHVSSSETFGEYAEPGNPSGIHGRNAWCRVKFNDGYVASWVFRYTYSSVARCALNCAYDCAHDIRELAPFRLAVLSANDKQNSQPKQIQNPIVLCDKNGIYHVKIGHEEFSGTRTEVLKQMTLRIKSFLKVR